MSFLQLTPSLVNSDEQLAHLLEQELEEDEIRLVLNQAKRYRDQTLASIRAIKRDPYTCGLCYTYRDPVVQTAEGDTVCTGCGTVLADHGVVDSFKDRERARRGISYPGYKHVFHFNERVANLACDDPRIELDVFALIHEAYWLDREKRGGDGALWYDDVRRVLRSVTVPHDIAEKYRGKRYKKLPLTDLDQKFSERWLTIRYRLTGDRPPEIDERVRRGIQLLFLGILPPFSHLRHKPECRREHKCHKRHGCAYKLPPYNFIIKELLYVHGGRELLNKYAPYLLHTTSAASLHKIRSQWNLVCEANRWVASYHPNADESRPLGLAMEG
jgi:hypothetical protein